MSLKALVDEFCRMTRYPINPAWVNAPFYTGSWQWKAPQGHQPISASLDPAYPGGSVGCFWKQFQHDPNPPRFSMSGAQAIKGLGYRIIHQQDTRRRIKALLDNQPPFSTSVLSAADLAKV